MPPDVCAYVSRPINAAGWRTVAESVMAELRVYLALAERRPTNLPARERGVRVRRQVPCGIRSAVTVATLPPRIIDVIRRRHRLNGAVPDERSPVNFATKGPMVVLPTLRRSR